MKKREFLSLVRNIRKDVKENIDKAIEENGQKMTKVNGKLDEALKRAFYEKFGDLTLKELAEKGRFYIYRSITRKGLYISTFEWRLDADALSELNTDEVGALVEEYLKLRERRDRLFELKMKQRRLIDAWKLRAIENGTYNKEPFPPALYEFVSEDLRQLITVEEPRGGEDGKVERP